MDRVCVCVCGSLGGAGARHGAEGTVDSMNCQFASHATASLLPWPVTSGGDYTRPPYSPVDWHVCWFAPAASACVDIEGQVVTSITNL